MRHGIVVCAFVLAAGLLLNGDLSAGSLEPPGPPAPTMKTLSQVEARTPISSLPVTISQPGSYYLTGDLTGVSGQSGITLQASHVTIDLNGFSLIGVPGSSHGINGLAFGNIRHVVIRNGVIRSWGAEGIAASNSSVIVEDMRLDGNTFSGMFVGSNSVVRNTISTQNGGHGIAVGSNSTITACTASANAGGTGLLAGTNSVVSGSTATANFVGIELTSASTATNCAALQNTTGFLAQPGSRIVHSVARGNVTGIAGDFNSVEECTVEVNTDDGIRVVNRSFVRGNLVRSNTNYGIQATGQGNRIEDNETTGNGLAGIRVDGINNLVVKNSAFLNATEYSIVAGNKLGTITATPVGADAWANFDL